MAAPSSVISHGTAASGDITDEPTNTPSVLVESVNFKFTRERREYKNRLGALRKLKYVNPLVVIAFAGWITSDASSTNIGGCEPGKEIAALSNYAAARRTFDPVTSTVGTLIAEDPEDDLSIEEDAKTKINILWAPFVENA